MSILDSGSKARFLLEITGAPAVEVLDFEANEWLSKPFLIDVNLASPFQITFEKAISKESLLTIKADGPDRYFHGIIRKFEHTGKIGSNVLNEKYLYHAQIVPFTKLLSLEQDCRIFQNKHVQEIVEDIIKDSKIPSDRYEFRLKNKEHKRRYCVQYRETDLDFINRILQEEGIYYFFEHSKDKHVMVFADDPVCYKPIGGNDTVPFKSASGMLATKEVITDIDFSQRLRPGTYTQTSYNFKNPSRPLETKEQSKNEDIQKYEIYDYPGQYGEQNQGKKLTKAKMEEQTATLEQAKGTGNCPRFITGHTFKLDGHDFKTFNKEYLLIEVIHNGQQPQTMEEQSGSGSGTTYHNTFKTIPSSAAYHPDKTIEKPYIKGIQSATVVGPKGEEIYVDGHGRVKVQFHWDRKGKNDDNSSCWLRCGQTWGGGGWGSVFIPRVGDEVLVSYMEGDPDWPIITGSVYNGANPPLYDLPANKTRTTIKTKSYPNSKGFNELRFEDKAGNEEVYLQGEKDWNILIKNDKGQNVGHDEMLNVGNNRTKTVGVDQSETIGVNKTIQVGANHTESIGANMNLTVSGLKNEFVTLASTENIGAIKTLTVGAGYAVSVIGGMNTVVGLGQFEEVGLTKKVMVGKTFDITAGDSFTITCGKSKITLDKSGKVVISGTDFEFNGSDHIQLSSDKVDIN